MEKTLHDYFYINTGNEIKPYSGRESSFLIEAANFHIDRSKGNHPPNTIPALDAFIYECMDEYYQNGVSDDLLNNLNEKLMHVKIQCLVENIQNKVMAVHAAYIPQNPNPLVFGAYMFSNVTSFGGLNELMRCKSDDCLKFFIGRRNAKWCSNTCGSKCRVMKMRKAKRARY